jgi:hypothetical protein
MAGRAPGSITHGPEGYSDFRQEVGILDGTATLWDGYAARERHEVMVTSRGPRSGGTRSARSLANRCGGWAAVLACAGLTLSIGAIATLPHAIQSDHAWAGSNVIKSGDVLRTSRAVNG